MRLVSEAFLTLAGVYAPIAAVYASSEQASLRGNNQLLHHRLLPGNGQGQGQGGPSQQTGTFLTADVESIDSIHTIVGVGNPNESTTRKLQGNSAGHRQDKTYHFMTDDGHIYELENFREGSFDGIQSGNDAIELPSQATANGKRIDLNGLGVARFPGRGQSANRGVRNLQEDDSMTEKQKRSLRELRRLAVYEGNKSVLAVRVVAADAMTTTSATGISDAVFGNGVDSVNLASQYGACSHGKLNIVKAAPRTAVGTDVSSIENGVVTVTVSTGIAEGDVTMREAISDALSTEFGLPPQDLADHLMYCLPPGTMGGAAYAFLNSWMSVYNDELCNSVSIQMHEVGHNLNFEHSNEGTGEYEDQSGMMGSSYGGSDTPLMCFNGPKSWQAGWYSDKSHSIFPNADAGTCFSGPVYGVDSYPTSPPGSSVLLRLDSNSGTDYFISFNGKQGINAGTVEDGNKVLITTGTTDTAQASWKIAKLSAGQSFTIADYDGTGRDVTITVNSVSGTESADISVQCGPELCSADAECDDFNQCTTNTCDGACTFEPIADCCGNGICETGTESYFTCFEDCAEGPFTAATQLCSSCGIADGNMFDVEAKDAAIAISSMKVRTYTAGTVRAEVWTKAGTFEGFEHNSGAWSKILDHSITTSEWSLIELPDFASPVDIAAGARQAFYVTLETAGDVLTEYGTGYTTVAGEDSNVKIFQGTLNIYPFQAKGGPNIWNGELTYMKNGDTHTLAPVPNPTSSPTPAPTPFPTSPPTTAEPTPAPTPLPTNAPVSTVVKYLCSKNDVSSTICLDGAPALGSSCLAQGDSCGNGGKICQLAECLDTSGPTPPAPTPPAPTPPAPTPPAPTPPAPTPPSCSAGGASCSSNSDCCTNSCTKTKGQWTCDA